jgi:hypothetical protein
MVIRIGSGHFGCAVAQGGRSVGSSFNFVLGHTSVKITERHYAPAGM